MLAGVEQVCGLASGNFAVAMFQIQAAPSPGMVSWRTWSAPRRMPSALTRPAKTLAGSKVAMTLVESRSRTGYPSLSSLSWVLGPGERDLVVGAVIASG